MSGLTDKRLQLAKLELELERLQYRTLCQNSFLAFVRHMHPEYVQSWFHLNLIDVFQKIGERKLTRVIISMPPRHTKTEHSRLFSAWYLGRNPNKKIISTSYSQGVSTESNRAVQNIMDDPRYAEIFPDVRLPSAKSSKLRNTTVFEIEKHSGSYYAAGIMGGLTGRGATGGILIDDPVKHFRDAASDANKATLEQEWKFSIRSRAETGAFIVIIMTRWLLDDFAGMRLQDAENDPLGDQWHVVRYAAVKDDPLDDSDPRQLGETLWPDKYGQDWAAATRAASEDAWQAMYQQRPTVIGGGILKTFKLKFWHYPGRVPEPYIMPNNDGELVPIEQVALPSHFGRTLQSWDMTFKKTKDGSFVVGQLWGSSAPDIPSAAFLLDQARARVDFDGACQMVRDMTTAYPGVREKWIEDKANGAAIKDHLQREIPGIDTVAPVGDKIERAQAASTNINAGNVYIPHPSLFPWVKEFLAELGSFPKGKNDDQVDAFTQAMTLFFGQAAWRIH